MLFSTLNIPKYLNVCINKYKLCLRNVCLQCLLNDSLCAHALYMHACIKTCVHACKNTVCACMHIPNWNTLLIEDNLCIKCIEMASKHASI